VSGSFDNTIRIWGVTSRASKLTLSGHTSALRDLAVLPDRKLASTGDDRTIKIYN
jgi:WD40 repeat protein